MKLTLFALSLIALTHVSDALACSCVGPPGPQKALEQSSSVFLGVVQQLAVEESQHGFRQVRVTFGVQRAWKGSPRRVAIVYTSSSEASCGIRFVRGHRYLVYANRYEGRLNAGLCSRTRHISQAAKDLEALGPGYIPRS